MSKLSEYISDIYSGKETEGEEAERLAQEAAVQNSYYSGVSDQAERMADENFYDMMITGAKSAVEDVIVSNDKVTLAGEAAPVKAPFNYSVNEAKEGYTSVAGQNIKTMYLAAAAGGLVLLFILKKR